MVVLSLRQRPSRFAAVARQRIETTRAEDEGCLADVFLQHPDEPRDYVLYEQWKDRAALDAHLRRLQKAFGPSASGRGLPPALLDFFETTRIVRYRVVG